MAESFLVLGYLNLTGETQVTAIFASRELGHAGNPLSAAVAKALAVFFHTRMVSRLLPVSQPRQSWRGLKLAFLHDEEQHGRNQQRQDHRGRHASDNSDCQRAEQLCSSAGAESQRNHA